jgi:hypothetical protein
LSLGHASTAQTFRVTKDLDIVSCLESLAGAVVESFWRLVHDGVYQLTFRTPRCELILAS